MPAEQSEGRHLVKVPSLYVLPKDEATLVFLSARTKSTNDNAGTLRARGMADARLTQSGGDLTLKQRKPTVATK